MDGDGQRLNHSTLVIAHGLRQGRYLGRVHGKILAGGAGGLESHDLQLLAEIVFAVGTGIAVPAADLRLDGDLLTHRQALHAAAHSLDPTGHLVTLCDGISGEGMLAMVDMYIRTADTDTHDSDQYLSLRRDGTRRLPEFDDAGCRHNLLQHIHSSFMDGSAFCRVARHRSVPE